MNRNIPCHKSWNITNSSDLIITNATLAFGVDTSFANNARNNARNTWYLASMRDSYKNSRCSIWSYWESSRCILHSCNVTAIFTSVFCFTFSVQNIYRLYIEIHIDIEKLPSNITVPEFIRMLNTYITLYPFFNGTHKLYCNVHPLTCDCLCGSTTIFVIDQVVLFIFQHKRGMFKWF